MKVFVTGAAGFIGSRLSRFLLDRGDIVVGFDNFNPYYSPDLKRRHLLDIEGHPNFSIIEGDLRDADLLLKLFQAGTFDTVAHIAAMAAVRYSVKYPLLYGEVNQQGTLNLLEAARLNGNPACIIASTGSVYGRDTSMPFREDAAAMHPLAPYPASKRAMEIFAHSHSYLYDLPITVLRFFNVYGPHGRPDMMPWQWSTKIQKGEPITLFNGGHMKRDWTYIDDIVRGFVAALDAGNRWEIVNLGCGNPVENLRFVRIIESLLGVEAEILSEPTPPSEPLETYASIEKAGRLFNWKPEVQVEEGLGRFIDWMRTEGHLS